MYELHNDLYHIIIVGLGGTGSQLLPFLSQLLQFDDKHKLTLIDGDSYEVKNRRNQKCSENDNNMNKAEAMSIKVKKNYTSVDVDFIPEYIKEKNLLVDFIDRCDERYIPIIVGCVDNNSTRRILSEVFKDIDKGIYIDSGNGIEDREGQIVIGAKIPTMEIFLDCIADVFPNINTATDDVDKLTGCAVNNKPQNVAINIFAAANLFVALNNIIGFNYIPYHVAMFSAENCEVVTRG